MANFTKSGRTLKAKKPRPDFPLFPHATGRWAKKVRGRLIYFGKTADDPRGEAALNRWLDEKDDLLAGRTPRSRSSAPTVADVCDAFLVHKAELVDSGELAERTFGAYKITTDILVGKFGNHVAAELRSDDFQALRSKLARRFSPIPLANHIQVVRSVFKFGYDSELLDKPVRFGPSFRKPAAKVIRKARTANGPKRFTAEQIRTALDCATVNMRAMILLAINGGLGNGDLAAMPIKAIDLKTGWLDYPRPKTGVPRRIPLWPETKDAIREVREARPDTDSPLLFIGRRGQDYIGNNRGYRVHQEAARVFKNAGIEGRTFYDLRRTFQTVAEGARDLSAVQAVMGHAAGSGDYRQGVDDDRLRAVCEYVRAWLW